MTIVGLLNPGAMGASIGAAASVNAEKVLWASQGRSVATKNRAEKAKLFDAVSIENLVSDSDVILSVCPPDNAMELARDVFAKGFKGSYVDCNAVAPAQARLIETLANEAGALFVDGGIIGGPAWSAKSGTKLWLSGNDAAQIAALFENSPLLTGVVGKDIGAASALKMTFAAYTKGSTALLAAILAVAEKEGVRDALAQQWGDAFTAQSHRQVIMNSAKAWRFSGEMEQIAQTFEGAGLPDGFHTSAAEVFGRLSEFKDWQTEPTLAALLHALRFPAET
ncbi:MAG: 3-hydroxyisobutyrate dehydrogenase-like beta-hydroxyacid dehydrogenase [Candidatus Azotimanducaceae bacterium]|jgi:3-hydroxyisobutyrate dehydrogenase-like beta-hydroxyacid dehydrogenase